jgi:hypothetical protein
MKITNDILRQIITEEISHYLAEETMQQQKQNAVTMISNILTRAEESGNLNPQDIINKAKESYEDAKTAGLKGDEMEKEDAIDSTPTNEACGDLAPPTLDIDPTHSHEDHEGSMAKRQMFKTAEYAAIIFDMLDDNEELPAWIQSKLTKIADYIGAVKHYLEYDHVMGEKLDKGATVEDHITDFEQSDAPQFRGKSKKKRREMAIAAHLDAQENK